MKTSTIVTVAVIAGVGILLYRKLGALQNAQQAAQPSAGRSTVQGVLDFGTALVGAWQTQKASEAARTQYDLQRISDGANGRTSAGLEYDASNSNTGANTAIGFTMGLFT